MNEYKAINTFLKGDIQIGSHEVCKTCRPPTILDIEDNSELLCFFKYLCQNTKIMNKNVETKNKLKRFQ